MTELATRPAPPAAALKQFLDLRADSLAKWVRGKIDPAGLIRFALLEFSQNEALQKCSPASIYTALIACAQVGLEPSGVKGEAYIVPFKGVAQFMPGYRGLIKLALRSGAVKSLASHLVYAADEFRIDLGTEASVIHRPALSARGPMIGAYALAKMANGEFDIEWMPLEELEKIRQSATRNGRESPAYSNWGDQMARKAPIRRICKRLPMGDDYALAARLDEAGESGDQVAYLRALDVDVNASPGEPASAPQHEHPVASRGMAALKSKITRRSTMPVSEEPPDAIEAEKPEAAPAVAPSLSEWSLTLPEVQS